MSTSLPSTMRSWVFSTTTGGIEKNLELRDDIALPPSARALKTDEVLVKTTATSLNPVDYKIAELPILGRLIISRPSSPGLDFAGRVVTLGPSSGKYPADVKINQPVIGTLAMPQKYGSLGEYIVCIRNDIAAAPQGLSAEDASSIGTAGLTAYQSLQPYIKEGDNVFINGGSGGVGLFGIQIAKALGCKVTVTCSSANADLCRSVGADKVIDYRTSNVVEELENSKPKYDILVDNVGTKELYWAMGKYTNPGAPCLQVATAPTFSDITDLLARFITPTFFGGIKRPLTLYMRVTKPDQLALLGQWVVEGKLKVIKDQVFAYEDAPRAFERLKTERARGKIVITSQ